MSVSPMFVWCSPEQYEKRKDTLLSKDKKINDAYDKIVFVDKLGLIITHGTIFGNTDNSITNVHSIYCNDVCCNDMLI